MKSFFFLSKHLFLFQLGTLSLFLGAIQPLKAQQQSAQESRSKQLKPAKKTAISFVPTYIFRSTLQIGIQRFNKYQDRSFLLYGGITGLSNKYLTESGYTAELQCRFYVKRFKIRLNQNEKAYQQGIYLGLWARGEQFESDYDYEDVPFFALDGSTTFLTYKGTQNIQALSAGIQFGFQQSFAEHFFIDLYVGAGYRGVQTEENIEERNTDETLHEEVLRWHNGFFARTYRGVLPRAGLSFGVLF